MEHKLKKKDVLYEADLEERSFLESHLKELQLTFLVIPELSTDGIRLRMIKALAQLINWEENILDLEIDKDYTVNSRFATKRKLPRDVLVHFVRTTTMFWIATLNKIISAGLKKITGVVL